MGNQLEEYEDFLRLRRYVMDALSKIDMSWGHKSYEGAFELTLSYPGYFDDGYDADMPDAVTIDLHCYVIGPARHYKWAGATIKEAVEKCKIDVEPWIKEAIDRQ